MVVLREGDVYIKIFADGMAGNLLLTAGDELVGTQGQGEFLAFAALFPEEEVLLFFVIPMKVKYLAYLDLGYFAIGLLFGSWSMRAAAVASLINFFLFFGPDYLRRERERRKFKAVRDNFRRQMNDDRRGW